MLRKNTIDDDHNLNYGADRGVRGRFIDPVDVAASNPDTGMLRVPIGHASDGDARRTVRNAGDTFKTPTALVFRSVPGQS